MSSIGSDHSVSKIFKLLFKILKGLLFFIRVLISFFQYYKMTFINISNWMFECQIFHAVPISSIFVNLSWYIFIILYLFNLNSLCKPINQLYKQVIANFPSNQNHRSPSQLISKYSCKKSKHSNLKYKYS